MPGANQGHRSRFVRHRDGAILQVLAPYIINAFIGMHRLSITLFRTRAARVRACSLLLGVLWIVVITACATAPPVLLGISA